MSDGGWKSEDAHDRGYTDGPSSRGVPIYVLFLIMLGSGIFTLVFLWICVKCIYHKRRVRRAARADVERTAAAAVQQAWELAAAAGRGAPANDDDSVAKDGDVKRGDAGDVELTYVVMAGEDQPTFLAKPLKTPNSVDDDDESVSRSPPTKVDDVPANPDKTSPS